jgi:CrcB protein
MEKFLLISIGAVVGANTRYWVGDWAAQRWGAGFPYGTLLINLSGSFLIGLFITIATQRFLIDPRWRILIAIGFLGAYTTFSTYAYESVNLIVNGHFFLGLFDLLGSALLGAIAVAGGILIGRLL